jgi:hypothetical protein
MSWRARRSGTAFLALALAACTYQPSMQTPKLPALVPLDTTMDCKQVDLAIDRADTVRWLIRDDGGSRETSAHRAARYTGNLLLAYVGGPAIMEDGGRALLNAADVRIRQLLQLKCDDGCSARATALPGMDDFALLGELEAVQAQLDAGSGSEAALLAERTRLLDGLRIVPAQSRVR